MQRGLLRQLAQLRRCSGRKARGGWPDWDPSHPDPAPGSGLAVVVTQEAVSLLVSLGLPVVAPKAA